MFVLRERLKPASKLKSVSCGNTFQIRSTMCAKKLKRVDEWHVRQKQFITVSATNFLKRTSKEIMYVLTYLLTYLPWRWRHRRVRACVQVRTPLNAGAVGRRTRATRRSSWRRTSSSIATCRAVGASSCRASCRWPSARSRSGSRTDAWRRSASCRRFANWTRAIGLITRGCRRRLRHPRRRRHPITKRPCSGIRRPIVVPCTPQHCAYTEGCEAIVVVTANGKLNRCGESQFWEDSVERGWEEHRKNFNCL